MTGRPLFLPGFVFLGCLLAAIGLAGAQGQGATLTVVVTGPQPSAGNIKVALFNSEQTFLKTPLTKKEVKVSDSGQTVISFPDLPPGEYAVSVIHDRDANGKLDRNVIGLPQEPVRFSNNVKIKFRRPAFDETRFLLDGDDRTIVIDFNS